MPDLLVLCEYPTLNGGERSMLATLDGVQAAGWSPAVMAPPEGPLASALAARGVEHIPFPGQRTHGVRLPLGPLREELAHLLRRRRPGLFHANSLAMGRLSGPVAADLAIRSIAHLRDIVRLSVQAVSDLNGHSRILAVSSATRTFHIHAGLAAAKTHVLYNGVDLEELRPRPPTGYLHRELGLPADAALVGNIGQIGLRKAQDVFLRAAVIASAAHPKDGTHYLIVGERNSSKEESRRYENDLLRTGRNTLGNRAHFLGRREDVGRLLNELTLLLHTARQEPLGRVLLEAAAAGVTVLATDVGGTAEIFPAASESARLVPPDDPETLAREIGRLLNDRTLREKLAAAARHRAERHFDIRHAVAGLVRHYEEVAASTR